MSPKPQPGIMNIAAYVGGKSSVGGNVDVLKLSSNEGALGPSPKAIDRLSSMSAWHRYRRWRFRSARSIGRTL